MPTPEPTSTGTPPASDRPMRHLRFDAIGAPWDIETPRPLPAAIAESIRARIDVFDATYSRFRPDSLVTRIAHAAAGGQFQFPSDAGELFGLYDQLYELTDGAIDPLVGQTLELLGYDPRYSLIPADPEARTAAHQHRKRWVDVQRTGTRVRIENAVVVDIGAAGKGYLVDLIAQLLASLGLNEFVIDASGDLRHHGPQQTRVGMEHPTLGGRVIGVVELQDAALCASATTRRVWGPGLHHILDARTGTPTHDVIATWAVADRAAIADGLASALFFADPQRLADQFDFSYARMRADGSVDASTHFPGDLFVPESQLSRTDHQRNHR